MLARALPDRMAIIPDRVKKAPVPPGSEKVVVPEFANVALIYLLGRIKC
jgi:hypothetical protein